MLLLALWLFIFRPILRSSRRRSSSGRPFVPAPASPALYARKPDWVIEEVVRLKAHLPDHGCRAIALTFNRLHRARHGMTVSKSWVARLVRARRLEIEARRREWKRRIPRPMASNLVWGLDLTGKMDTRGEIHPILGVVDQWALGIRHQRTEPHCPWQNGRVERFFGTLKASLDRLVRGQPRTAGLGAGRLPRLVQPRAPAPAPGRADAGGSVGVDRSVCEAAQASALLRGMGRDAHRLLDAPVAGTGKLGEVELDGSKGRPRAGSASGGQRRLRNSQTIRNQ